MIEDALLSSAGLANGEMTMEKHTKPGEFTAPADFVGFRASEVKTKDNTIFLRTQGTGPGLLLIHGFPRTHLMWRHLAPQLTDRHTVVCVDLRGYGQSGSPVSTDDHFPYSKRAMASELVEVMDRLGFPRFSVVGHDRGGRVSYRMALDHPEKVEQLAVFDVIPILEAWSHADATFAQTYWPWSLLSQKPPLPEKYLLGAPDAVFDNPFGAGSFPAEIREQYIATYRNPDRVHAICEEYRAATEIDVEHDRIDLEAHRHITCPMLHLWAAGGWLDTYYANDGGPLGIWRRWAPQVQGQAIRGGHFFPEENPTDTAELLRSFLLS
jgi:haloacetate dehalogenase